MIFKFNLGHKSQATRGYDGQERSAEDQEVFHKQAAPDKYLVSKNYNHGEDYTERLIYYNDGKFKKEYCDIWENLIYTKIMRKKLIADYKSINKDAGFFRRFLTLPVSSSAQFYNYIDPVGNYSTN